MAQRSISMLCYLVTLRCPADNSKAYLKRKVRRMRSRIGVLGNIVVVDIVLIYKTIDT